jgi:hypothetical protein
MTTQKRTTTDPPLVRLISWFLVLMCVSGAFGATPKILDERPARPGEWGFRPVAEATVSINPPSFSWRPQQGLRWELQCARDSAFKDLVYKASHIEFNVHCPPRVLTPGRYTWRYRGKDDRGRYTQWSQSRAFSIASNSAEMPLPVRDELLARVPKTHPRLFVRPEGVSSLATLAQGRLRTEYRALVRECDKHLKNPPATKEPPTYPADMERKGEAWRKMWWGNRTYTIKALNSAATLAFTRLIGGKEAYGLEAKRILMECAQWDPKGSTGYRYNDEAGMPYAYYFSRTYTFVNDLLSEQEKQICRRVMKSRGDEMYRHLCPRHLWQPYASHSNRAWHFLGEVGIAFLNEVEGAGDWVWFATNVFFNVYPVWSDDDGGWHEGSSYWSSYISRFTWWADIMRVALDIDAFDKPFFDKIGYYPMYLLPPNKVGGGFGDLTARRTAKHNVGLGSVLAAQAQNPYWQWYVKQLGGPTKTDGYIGFVRGQLPRVEAKAPTDLPTSRLFAGTGQATLNADLMDAGNSVQVVFKSSPFGTQSHGYEANNSFLLWAYGQRLLIRSGYRDVYGSAHHTGWMWSTRSTNCITVNGAGQGRRTSTAQGRIVDFTTTPEVDVVVGEAGSAYEEPLERFTRTVVFIKPELVVVYDRLRSPQASTFEYWLHALKKIEVKDQHSVMVRNQNVECQVDFMWPDDLTFTQTDQYDPNPRERITLREWHLTAQTAVRSKQAEFVTLYRPCRAGQQRQSKDTLAQLKGGYRLNVEQADGRVEILLPRGNLTAEDMVTVRLKRDGKTVEVSGKQR